MKERQFSYFLGLFDEQVQFWVFKLSSDFDLSLVRLLLRKKGAYVYKNKKRNENDFSREIELILLVHYSVKEFER
jgi:hypothetical protein